MIKLGIFGDSSTNPELLEQVKNISDTTIEGVYYSGNAKVPKGLAEYSGPIALMDNADAILILTNRSNSSDMIKLILRKSKHMYLKTIPTLNVKEIKELIGLEKEAGIISFIYNPFNYIPFLDPFRNEYERPLLINLRTCFQGSEMKHSDELLLLITALNHLVQSNYKKLEIFGLNSSGQKLVVNLRIEYNNGSVINLTISQEKSSGCFEIFDPKGRVQFEFQSPLYLAYPQFNQEYFAICNFIRFVQNPDRTENSFDNLMNGLHIVKEIQEHLRFNGLDF